MAAWAWPADRCMSACATAHQRASIAGRAPAWAWIDVRHAAAARAADGSWRATATSTAAMASAKRQAMSEPPLLTFRPASMLACAASSRLVAMSVSARAAYSANACGSDDQPLRSAIRCPASARPAASGNRPWIASNSTR